MLDIGVRLPSENDWDTTVEYATFADQHALSSVWVAEGWGRNAIPLMTQLLEATDRIDVCAGIFNIYSRTPALMAMTARAFCDRYGERFRLGIGASGKNIIEGLHGQSFESPLRRTREYIEIINTLLDGRPAEYDGEIFDLSGVALQDIDRSYEVPIYVAALGQTNLQLTGEFADGWLPLLVPLERFSDAIETLQRGAQRADRPVSDVTKAPYVPTCLSATDPDQSRESVRELIAWYVGGMGSYYHRTLSEFGYSDTADAIQDAWRDGDHDQARNAVSDELLDSLSLCGHPDQVSEKLDRFEAAGIDEVVAYLPPRAPDDLLEETLEHLGNVVS